MKLSMKSLSSRDNQLIWKLDPVILHEIDFLAYRLGVFHAPTSNTTSILSNSNKITPKSKRLKSDRLNNLVERHRITSNPTNIKDSQILREEIKHFSSLELMQKMMRKWQKRDQEMEFIETQKLEKEEAENNAVLSHPNYLFSDEAEVLFRFGMGSFVSPNAPGFSGLFRQHWKDFIVTEMIIDSTTGLGTPISRELDWSIPKIPNSLLENDVNMETSDFNFDTSEPPPQSFFTVNVEERVSELLKEGNGELVKSNNVDSTIISQSNEKKILNNSDSDNDKFDESICNKGKFYLQCYLHKQHIAHSVALSNIAQTLRMHPSGISVAGIKDYIGDTIQRVRLENISPAAALQANKIFRKKKWSMTLSNFSYHTEPLVPGRLFGNHFKIVLRDVTAPLEDIEKSLHEFALNGFPNYYGCQRFSWFGGQNDAAFALLHHNWLVFAFRFLGYTKQEKTLRELLQREKKYPNPIQDEYRRNIVRRLRQIAMEPSELDVPPFLSCPSLHSPATSINGGPISKKQELIILQLHGAFLDLSVMSRRLTAQRLCSYLWNQVLTLRLHHFGIQVLKGDMILSENFRKMETSSEERKDWYREGIRFVENESEKHNYSITDVIHPGFSFNGIRRPLNAVGEYYLQICEKYKLDWYTQHSQAGIHDFLEPPRPIIRKPMNLRYHYNKSESKLTLEFALERGCYANVAISELMKLIRCAGSDAILLLPTNDALWELGNRDPGYVTSVQDIYSGFQDGLGFVSDTHEIPLTGETKIWDNNNNNNNNNEVPLFLPEHEDPARKAYRWGSKHLLRNMERRIRDEEKMKLRLFEKPLARQLKDGEVGQYAGHTVPMSPNTKGKRIFFKVLKRQKRFPGAPKLTSSMKRGGGNKNNKNAIRVPFRAIDKNTWNVTW